MKINSNEIYENHQKWVGLINTVDALRSYLHHISILLVLHIYSNEIKSLKLYYRHCIVSKAPCMCWSVLYSIKLQLVLNFLCY